MSAAAIETPPGKNDELVFTTLDNYPWKSDEEFQSGLQAILGPNPAPDQAENLTLRARCFYYSRKHNIPIDFQAYKTWRDQHAAQPSAESHSNAEWTTTKQAPQTGEEKEEKPPYPMSFNQIVELITKGEPIPGIKEIPDTLLEGQASQSTSSKRKKPWEKQNDETRATQVELAAGQ